MRELGPSNRLGETLQSLSMGSLAGNREVEICINGKAAPAYRIR